MVGGGIEQSYVLPTHGFLNELSGLDGHVLNEGRVRRLGTPACLCLIRIQRMVHLFRTARSSSAPAVNT